MSKNKKPYHNYNNYSANTAPIKTAEPVVEETVELTPVTEEVEQVEVTEIVEETVGATVEVTAPAPTIGVVNCAKLRMRDSTDTNTNDNIIYELPEGTEVQINEEKSTADFYHVTIPTGAEGFCMKKFITIK